MDANLFLKVLCALPLPARHGCGRMEDGLLALQSFLFLPLPSFSIFLQLSVHTLIFLSSGNIFDVGFFIG